MSYNILHNPAMYALYSSGENKEVSILQIFKDLRKIKNISGDTALQEFPLTRLLIAILYRAYKDSLNTIYDWEILWENGIDYSIVESYLLKYESRFDLLSEDEPFYQVSKEIGIYDKEEKDTSNESLLIDHQRVFYKSNADNNLYFSNSTVQGIKEVSYSEAFRALVTLQNYNTASRKSILKTDPRIKKRTYAQLGWAGNFSGVLLLGNNLEETLLLNTVPYKHIKSSDILPEKDFAVWEKPQQNAFPANDTWKGDSLEQYGFAEGIAEILTFQQSRIYLRNNGEKISGAVVGIGDRIFVYDQFVETMAAHRKIERDINNSKVPARIPVTLRNGSAWSNINALLAFADSDPKIRYEAPMNIQYFHDHVVEDYDTNIVDVRVFTVFYGAQNAIIENWNVSSLDISRDAFNNDDVSRTLIKAADLPTQIVYCVEELYKGVLRASGNTRPLLSGSLKSSVLNKFENNYGSLSSTITVDNIPEKQQEWIEFARKVAYEFKDEITQSATSSAMQGSDFGGKNFTVFHALNNFENTLYKKLKGAF